MRASRPTRLLAQPEQDEATRRWIVQLRVGLVFAVILGIALRPYLEEARSVRWDQASGVVVVSEIRTREGFRGSTARYLDLRYRYSLVNGQSYFGHRVTVGHRPVETDGLAQRYPVGREVLVYFDPARPDSAVLEPGLDAERRFLFHCTAVCLALVSAWLAVVVAVLLKIHWQFRSSSSRS